MTARIPKQDQSIQDAKKNAILIGQCETSAIYFSASTFSKLQTDNTLTNDDVKKIWLLLIIYMSVVAEICCGMNKQTFAQITDKQPDEWSHTAHILYLNRMFMATFFQTFGTHHN